MRLNSFTDARYVGELYEIPNKDNFCSCCGSSVEYTKVNITPRTTNKGIRLIINNVARREGEVLRKAQKIDDWMYSESISENRTVVSNVKTRNGPITVVVRTQ